MIDNKRTCLRTGILISPSDRVNFLKSIREIEKTLQILLFGLTITSAGIRVTFTSVVKAVHDIFSFVRLNINLQLILYPSNFSSIWTKTDSLIGALGSVQYFIKLRIWLCGRDIETRMGRIPIWPFPISLIRKGGLEYAPSLSLLCRLPITLVGNGYGRAVYCVLQYLRLQNWPLILNWWYIQVIWVWHELKRLALPTLLWFIILLLVSNCI